MRVHEERFPGEVYQRTGAYRLDVVAVNRAPELVPAPVALGDTVTGERIEPRGDVDEYALGSPGAQTIVVDFQTPIGAYGWPGLTLEVIEAASGTVVGTVTSINPTSELEDLGTGPIVLDSQSSYVIRVRGAEERHSHGVYRFAIRTHDP